MGPTIDYIPAHDDNVGLPRFYMVNHPLQGVQIAMNIGQNRYFHPMLGVTQLQWQARIIGPGSELLNYLLCGSLAKSVLQNRKVLLEALANELVSGRRKLSHMGVAKGSLKGVAN